MAVGPTPEAKQLRVRTGRTRRHVMHAQANESPPPTCLTPSLSPKGAPRPLPIPRFGGRGPPHLPTFSCRAQDSQTIITPNLLLNARSVS